MAAEPLSEDEAPGETEASSEAERPSQAKPLDEAKRMRMALMLVIIGLVVQSFCVIDITPGTFLLFALISVPLVLAGMGIFVATVWRVLRETRGL